MTRLFANSTCCLALCGCLIAGSAIASQRYGGQQHRGRKHEMVYVPPGEFLMGHSPGGPEYGPTRRVFVDSFWISKNNVTVSQFADFFEATGHKFDWDARRPPWGWDGKDDRPMVNVS